MKTKLLFLTLLSTITIYAQTQIGADIDGEAAEDESGIGVSLSADGSVIAIGAIWNDENGTSSGHVRVFQNSSEVWTQIGGDIDGEAEGDKSGWSTSLSADGSILAIGAPYNHGNGTVAGHVRVYKFSSDSWTQIGPDIDGKVEGERSGWSVSLSSDGSAVAIGSPYKHGNDSFSGHVRVFQYNSDVWKQIGDDIDGEGGYTYSGYSVSLSSDGTIVAIGAYGNRDNGIDSGHVRVYRNNLGVWTQIGDDIDGEAAYDYSGWCVSLSSDGSVVAIGGWGNDGDGTIAGENFGHVRVYQNNANVWTQIGDDIDGEASSDESGYSISLSADGSVVAIGADDNGGSGIGSGHVRVFKNMSDVWTQIGPNIDGEEANDHSGQSLSLSSDGTTVAIGAPLNDGNGQSSGHVRVYNLSALLSLENNEIAKNFTLCPNPVTNQLHIQLVTNLAYNKATIYNYFGQLVLQSNTTSIDVSNLTSGVYLLEVETNEGKGIKKFIKQ